MATAAVPDPERDGHRVAARPSASSCDCSASRTGCCTPARRRSATSVPAGIVRRDRRRGTVRGTTRNSEVGVSVLELTSRTVQGIETALRRVAAGGQRRLFRLRVAGSASRAPQEPFRSPSGAAAARSSATSPRSRRGVRPARVRGDRNGSDPRPFRTRHPIGQHGKRNPTACSASWPRRPGHPPPARASHSLVEMGGVTLFVRDLMELGVLRRTPRQTPRYAPGVNPVAPRASTGSRGLDPCRGSACDSCEPPTRKPCSMARNRAGRRSGCDSRPAISSFAAALKVARAWVDESAAPRLARRPPSGEHLDQDQPGDEAADVGRVSNAACLRAASQQPHARNDLEEEPHTDGHPRRHLCRGPPHQHAHASAWSR